MNHLTLLFALVGAALIAPDAPATNAHLGASATEADAVPSWIWYGSPADNPEAFLQRTFEVSGEGHEAILTGSCDNHMTVRLNGRIVTRSGTWEHVVSRDVSSALLEGKNVLTVRVRNEGGPAGLALSLTYGDDVLVTDASWQCAVPGKSGADAWVAATVIGRVGAAELPWTGSVNLDSFRASLAGVEQQEPSAPQAVRAAEGLNLLEGFEAELLYTVPRNEQGSWVALATDDQGRLYTSDQGGQGLYRVTPAAVGVPGATTTVERVEVEVSGAQGMCWAFDSLYVNVNGQGVWRIRDTDGDDQLDDAVNLIPLGNGGEHGPHALMPTRDGKGLYFIGGNHTNPPPFDNSLAPSNWSEDLLLPRQWDARGHARGKLAPGGWIARCDPDGKNIEIISSGYRNQYDIAINRQGEMFTYDADMEYDTGMPWYRPTRVCHVTSGSEFGWRSGTGKWPAYYEDSLPPVLDIGPGSPTGTVFGTGARFPAKYQDALFILDWTFGTIYALHMQPDGASYSATKEDFVWAKPLGVTDAVIGDDGALYFTVGGRGAQSALYRVIYTGSESTEPSPAPVPDAGKALRELRHSLEQYHGRVDPAAVDAAWPHLANDDRFVRFAARIAIENQPVATWRSRALDEPGAQASVIALIALARQGEASDLAGIAAALGRLDLDALPEQQALAALRAYAVAFARLGEPGDALREQVIASLDPHFPASSNELNTEFARLLTYLRSPSVVAKTMALVENAGPTELPPWAELIQRNDTYGGPIEKMLDDMPPLQSIGYAFILRNAAEGWTMPTRRAYFSFFVDASKHAGGASYGGFLANMRSDAEEKLTVAEQRSLASVLGQSLVASLPDNITPPVGPGTAWTTEDAGRVIGESLAGRDFDRGRNLFHATTCSACHRFAGEGGAIGPDLTTVANKFSIADLLEAVVDPSKVISDQYGSHLVLAKDGEIAEGILVEEEDEVLVYLRDHAAPPVVFDRSEIAVIKESAVSQMPAGLVDGLNPEELKDLVAYLLSGGNKKAEVFKSPDAPAGGRD